MCLVFLDKGLYKKKPLGSFGDISFNSLKKIIPNINSGGVLKINSNELQRNSNKCFENAVVFKISFITNIINKIRILAKYMLLNFFRLNFFRPKYENYYFAKKAKKTN